MSFAHNGAAMRLRSVCTKQYKDKRAEARRSYTRNLGANDRIRLAQLGCGGRSQRHVHMVQMAAQRTPVEVVAVCDIWKVARERRAAQVKPINRICYVTWRT
jgi:hypothetical protein